MAERFVIQRALTKEVLSYDLRGVSRDALSRKLSAVGSMTLTVGSAQATVSASDGLPMFQEWGTIVTLDDDGDIRFRGLVTDMDYNGPSWTVTVSSMATYPFGMPYEGDAYYGAQVDPADISRMLWAHVQSFPDSDLGVTVVGKTPVRVGSFSTQNKADTLAAYNAAVMSYNAANKELQRLRGLIATSRTSYSAVVAQREAASRELTAAKKAKDPARIAAAQTALNEADNAKAAQNRIISDQQSAIDAQASTVAARKAEKDRAYTAKVAASKASKDDGGAYTLLPWEAPDCGQKIGDLAASTPFDWVERHFWDANDLPQTQIVIAYPRTGRRLGKDTDPTFVQGVNITVALQPSTSGSDFANAVYGVGSGEGAGSVRRSITRRNGRLRRVAAFQSKDIKSAGDLDARLRAELNARQDTLAVASITVANHVNSPRGSYSLGDDILVRGLVPHYGPFSLWHRVVGITDRADGVSELTLERSDAFTYGTGVDG